MARVVEVEPAVVPQRPQQHPPLVAPEERRLVERQVEEAAVLLPRRLLVQEVAVVVMPHTTRCRTSRSDRAAFGQTVRDRS